MAQGIRKTMVAACVAAMLTACGGGGGPGSPSSTAEGLWYGQTSTGYIARLAVLENGESWGLYSTTTAIVGALYGNTVSGGGSLSGTGGDFNFLLRTVVNATYSGTYSPKAALSATTSGGASFSGNYSATYDTPASLATVAGQYTGVGISRVSAATSTVVAITAAGAVTATNPFCSGSGNIVPRPGDKAIYNLSITFAGTNCGLTGVGPLAGIAYFEASTRQLVAMGLNGAKTDGLFWIGTK